MFDGIQIDPILFVIPLGDGFAIYWYGILIAIGILLAAWWGSYEIKKRGHSADELYNGLLVVVLSGYFFARLGYVIATELNNPGQQFNSLWEMFNLRDGGLDMFWGMLGGALAGYIFLRWRKLSVWDYADVAGPALLLAQALGRWGNFINQELYGVVTTRPWGILIEPAYRVPPFNDLTTYPLDTRFHPLFLYESLAFLIGFAILAYLCHQFRDIWRAGTIFGITLIWWGGNRFWIELFRPDQPTFGNSGITNGMISATVIMLLGVILLLVRYDRLHLGFSQTHKRPPAKPKRTREL
jgi:phosphatidylglycerol---prolipoprotein diacylglyceryl transferase